MLFTLQLVYYALSTNQLNKVKNSQMHFGAAGGKEIEFGSFEVAEDCEHNRHSVVAISGIFLTQIFLEMVPFVRIWRPGFPYNSLTLFK